MGYPSPSAEQGPTLSDRPVRSSNIRNTRSSLLQLGLFLSGFAGLLNEVLWQRALKFYCGGSETLSSATVVLVFLGGIGIGSFAIGKRVSAYRNPLRALIFVELLLAVFGLLICGLFSLDLQQSAFLLQRSAQAVGIPLRFVYALTAATVLLPPCVLMGMTMPLAAELLQRRDRSRDSRIISIMFAVNTAGAVCGALLGTSLLLPILGQQNSLLFGCAANLVATLLFSALIKNESITTVSAQRLVPSATFLRTASHNFLALGFVFGFCSLWHQMYLYRSISLRFEPLPLVFSAVLTAFLCYWTFGLWLSSGLRTALKNLVLVTAGMIVLSFMYFALVPKPTALESVSELLKLVVVHPLYWIPCVGYGLLFGTTVRDYATEWGKDTANFSAVNTLGACLGIVAGLFLGYELNLPGMILVEVLILLSGLAFLATSGSPMAWRTLCLSGAVTVLLWGVLRTEQVSPRGEAEFYGRDGVIIVDEKRNIFWDGLWHSRLASDNDHVGTNNWVLAVDPVLVHLSGNIKKVLAIGLGAGVTAATLSKLNTVEVVDAYDINTTLKRLLKAFPEGTLNVADNPKVNLIWQDGRSGVALSDARYDIITQQPLYLKQAGASILLSEEYFRLVESRLNPGGVLCIYSNGSGEQAWLVRQTVAKVFPHMLVLHKGYSILASMTPLAIDPAEIERRLQSDDPFWREIADYRTGVGDHEWKEYLAVFTEQSANGNLTITDDSPLVEYEQTLAKKLSDLGISQRFEKPIFRFHR